MREFRGYELIEKLNESQRSLIYRAVNKKTKNPCVLKILKIRHPSLSDIARFRHEYEIIKNSNTPGIIRTREILLEEDSVAIELEYFDGTGLKNLIGTAWMNPGNILETAVKLSETLGALHQEGISHRDIKPQNILVNSETGDVRITDFGISSAVTHENEELYNPGVIEGTLFYMSPEQTGRMNRSVDYRTDIYSLGITLYEMASGKPPFISDDPMEIIFSHIARNPLPLSDINREIPPVLSAIIQKCLAKTAEERYQNAYGLAADLKTCLQLYRNSTTVPDFPIAQKDISDRFNIPQKLYGREKELELLLSSFDRVGTGTKELCIVSGSPGIGKSALIEELQKPIVGKRGYYIFGKYDQFKRDVPYSGLIQALQALVKQILTESSEKIDLWRKNLIAALGPNGKIITNAIPALELIIGEQPPLPELGPEGSQNRFVAAFKNFITVFARREHPIVIFLDDLQWADPASINMLERLMLDREIRHIFIIGAYRENELNNNPRLHRLISFLKESGIPVSSINLGPVSRGNFISLLKDILKCTAEEALPLADLIYDKTGGNPFFFIQFLKSLYNGHLIKYKPDRGWEWDFGKIRSMEVTENVVQLMAEKISSLNPESIEVLKVCACIGNRFDLETLSIVYERPVDDIVNDLSQVVKEGLVFDSGDYYRFLHDRIQEAAYSLISDEEKPALHYRIGSWVKKNSDSRVLIEMVFYIVNHLNTAIDIIKSSDEKRELLELNRIAGNKAKLSTAYESASKYFETALSLLDKNQWQSDYAAAFDIRMNLAECEHLNRNFDRAEELFTEMAENAENDYDRARVYNLKVMMIASLGRHSQAVAAGMEGLSIFGLKLNPDPGNMAIAFAALKIKFLMKGRSIESIGELKTVDDEKNLLLMQYLMNLTTTAYYHKTELSILLAIKMFELTLKHGLSRYSAYACLVYGTVLGAGLGDFSNGYRLGKLAFDLNERFNNAELMSKLSLLFGATVSIWKERPEKSISYIKKAFDHCMDNGDLNYAIFTIQAILINMIPAGINLDHIYNEYASHIDLLIELRDPGAVNYLISVRQFIQALKGETSSIGSMDDHSFSEQEHIKAMDNDNIPIVTQRHFQLKAQLQYLFHDYTGALASSEKSENLIKYSLGQIVVPEHYFYRGMIFAEICGSDSYLKKFLYKSKIKSILNRFRKWSKLNPSVFTDKEFKLKAELARIEGDNLAALSFYSKAADAAIKAGFKHTAALANERAGILCFKLKLNGASKSFMTEAASLYASWGAAAKVKEIEEAENKWNADLLSGEAGVDQTISESITSTGTSISDRLDLSTVLKSALAISSEIQLERLLAQMVHLLMENAGADRGVILIERKGSLFIEAEGRISEEVSVLKSIPVEPGKSDNGEGAKLHLPLSIINYASRTGEPVVVKDMSMDPMFRNDPYVVSNRTGSALCVPVFKSGKLRALLYLENSLVTGAFTPERVEMMKLLSAQIAISIDNASLYSNMERMVEDRTAQLKHTLDEVQALKEQQDGDYFLTSMLLEPLNVLKVTHPLLKISRIVKSKKQFTFRKWQRELGGDICIAYDLILNGKKMVVFVNADAMGKSIQGAGGAIVFGSVFKAMVERTNNSPRPVMQSPQEWIISALRGLQSVFVSFDCSMMISLVLGIVDPAESRLYFMNAEHPFTVLYRDAKGRFLEKELIMRKLGVPELMIPESVYTVDLQPGDVIISGSDGRDDILIAQPGSSEKIMNEDENLFLKIVEESKASLDEIEKSIELHGEVTDDVAIIRIEYIG